MSGEKEIVLAANSKDFPPKHVFQSVEAQNLHVELII